MSGIRQILYKELARVLKDKKMLFSVFFLPVIVMIGVMSFTSSMAERVSEDVEAHTSSVWLENAPQTFQAFLEESGAACDIHTVKDAEAVKEMLKNGEADLWISFPEDFQSAVDDYKPGDEVPQVKTYYNPSEDYSAQAYEIISVGVLEGYRQQLLSTRVEDMEGLTVFTVNSDNPDMIVQDEERAGGKMLGMLLPYFVTVLLFAGAMGIGTDMIAGEKERGTMASLLVSPIKRSSIVLGKVFALMLISGLSSIIYVAALVLFMPRMLGSTGEDLGFSVSLNPGQIVMLAALLVAIAFLYSAIIVLVSVFAKTVKEASTYIMPVYMLILLLGIVTMFTTSASQGWVYAVPLYNVSIALQGILTRQVTIGQYGLALGITLLSGAAMVVAIAKAFDSEKVMSI